tara:strand:- start:1989 stop:2312 length:324 start_codon:yes stop_codon:yes gene_type:complete
MNGKSIHLIEPFTSTPINGTKAKNIKNIKNKYLESLNNLFLLIAEKVIKIDNPRIMKNRCFMKKKYVLVFNLSDAIIDVETSEKNNPREKRIKIKKKINLSIFFHQP